MKNNVVTLHPCDRCSKPSTRIVEVQVSAFAPMMRSRLCTACYAREQKAAVRQRAKNKKLRVGLLALGIDEDTVTIMLAAKVDFDTEREHLAQLDRAQ